MHAAQSDTGQQPECIPSACEADDQILGDDQARGDIGTAGRHSVETFLHIQNSRWARRKFSFRAEFCCWTESIRTFKIFLSTRFQITVSTVDRRKLQLIFKINIIELNNKILVDFRLSKGDGIEFKRRFLAIKKSMIDIICKETTSW